MALNRPYVTFRCRAFNTTVAKEIFAFEGNFGDDVADWLANRLSERDWEVSEEIEQEEHGWYFGFGRDRDGYDLGITFLNLEEARWLAWVEPQLGFFGNLLKNHDREIPLAVLTDIHACLVADPLVTDVRWHTRDEFRRGNFEGGSETP